MAPQPSSECPPAKALPPGNLEECGSNMEGGTKGAKRPEQEPLWKLENRQRERGWKVWEEAWITEEEAPEERGQRNS